MFHSQKSDEPMMVVLTPERMQGSKHIALIMAMQGDLCSTLKSQEPMSVKLGEISSNSTDAGSPISSTCPSDDEFEDESLAENTSVILKNIVPGCDRETLLRVLREHGFLEHVNFAYLPMAFDKKSTASFRYAFINFAKPCAAAQFHEQFAGFKNWGNLGETSEGCTVEWCGMQGLEAHIERYRNSPMMHYTVPDDFKPVLLSNGLRMPFPPPTEVIKAPRLRRHKDLQVKS